MAGPPRPDRRSVELDARRSGPLPQPDISAVSNRLRTPLVPDQLGLLEVYARLVAENQSTNLTGTKDRATIYRRHFTESLAILAALEGADLVASPMLDIGSGAGFPGVPMKIARPDLDLVLIESNGKKARFLETLVAELALDGTRVIQGRAEELGRDADLREAFPLVLARAVAPLPELLELALPFVSLGGVLAAPKGSGAAREIREAENALNVLGGEILSAERLRLPAGGAPLTLIVVRKVALTPQRYPRRAGIPHKRPL